MRISVSGIRTRVPETPPRATLGWSYSGLRLIYDFIFISQIRVIGILLFNGCAVAQVYPVI
ncbi:MAG: hypothetical protein WCS87_17590 [Methylococcaceae bacterium]